MEKLVTSLAIVIALVSAFVWGWYAGGRHSAKVVCANSALTTCDTLWEVIHDTAWVETSVKISRIDTVRLAYVPEIVKSGTFGGSNVPESAKTGTYTDTLIVHDSVFVEVPIERKTFTGENWRVTAHGYRVGLDEVWINRPTIYVTKTQTKTKRWAFNVGAQIGYGYTAHGASPYVGIGAGFGYTF